MLLEPQLLGALLPALGVDRGAGTEVIDILGRHVLGALGVGLVDDLRQDLRVLEHRAGLEHVVVKGVVTTICLEDGLLEALEQRLLLDVDVGVVNKDAGLHVAAGVDVAIHTAAGDAAAHVLAVILEVHGKDRLAALDGADLADALEHVLALLDGRAKVDRGALADGHVVEVPGPAATLLDDLVEVLVGADHLGVGAGVGRGRAVEQAVCVHEVEGAHDLLVGPVAAATVVGVLRALKRDAEDDVAHALDLVAEGLVNKGGVGEDVEQAVVVGLGEADDVALADERLAAGEHIEVAAEVGALRDQAIHVLIREVEAVAVIGSPAADALLVAGARGIEEDDPRNVALLLLGVGGGVAQSAERRLVAAVQDRGLEDVVVGVVDDIPEELLPLGARVQAVADAADGAGGRVLEQLAGHIEQLVELFLAVGAARRLDDLVERDTERLSLRCMGNLGLHGAPPLITGTAPTAIFEPASNLDPILPRFLNT